MRRASAPGPGVSESHGKPGKEGNAWSNRRSHVGALSQPSGDPLLIAQAGRVHQHFSGPAVDVELSQQGPHRTHAVALLLYRHGEGGRQRVAAALQIVGIDDESFASEEHTSEL